MPRPFSPGSQRPFATARQLKLLVLVLTLSNIGLGVFSFRLLRKLDESYSDLIDHSVPVLNELQSLTAKSVRAMRTTHSSPAWETPEQRAEAVRLARAAFADEADCRATLLAAVWLSCENEARKEFETAGAQFATIGGQLVARLAAGDVAGAASMRDEKLRPAFEHFLEATTKAADVVEAESLRLNHRVSASAGNMSNVLLGIASWPVVLFCGVLALTGVFVVVLLVLFRGRELGDTP
jgi:hypothetical protein